MSLVGGPHDGDLVGTSTLGDIDAKNESAHIGWTAYDPRIRGTAVNAEAKLLLLGTAFDHGFGRVKIQTDVINKRSRAAISGMGQRLRALSVVIVRAPTAPGATRPSTQSWSTSGHVCAKDFSRGWADTRAGR